MQSFVIFWQEHYPMMKIKNPSQDSCSVCWEYHCALSSIHKRKDVLVNTNNSEGQSPYNSNANSNTSNLLSNTTLFPNIVSLWY